jgi:hypothetical protein
MKAKGILRTVIISSESRYFLTQGHFKDNSLVFIFKKFERILNALYLLTNHIDNSEVIKNKIRECAVQTLLDISKSANFTEELKKQAIQESLTGIINLQSLIETMAVSGLIKEQSYLLVFKELEEVFKVIFDRVKGDESSHLLRDEFFNIVPPGVNDFKRQDFVKDINDKKQLDNQTDNKIENNFSPLIGAENKESFKVKDLEISDRRNRIVSFFAEKDKLTLKDVAVLLPSYGEKTLQRELLHLVSIGVLGREGKKRWTQYFLLKKL